jgi:hypothetical protein
VPDQPNERVHVDLLGPLKSTTDKKYVLAITEAFTKIATLVALPDKEATTVAEAILHRWVYWFSAAVHLFSDQGKEFCNKVMDKLCELLGTKRSTTAPYHPQSNAQVERLNRTILDFLRAEIPDDSKSWEAQLPSFEFHYNSSFHSSIGTSPWELLYGPNNQTFQSHLDRWKAIQDLQEKARQTALKSKVKQKQAHDKKAQLTELKKVSWYGSKSTSSQIKITRSPTIESAQSSSLTSRITRYGSDWTQDGSRRSTWIKSSPSRMRSSQKELLKKGRGQISNNSCKQLIKR